MNDNTYCIPFSHPNHGIHDVAVVVTERDDDYVLSCVLPLSGLSIESEADDCFKALQFLRRDADRNGWSIRCLGSRRNVWPSGMSRSMGGGLRAYVLRLGKQATELVDILASDPDPDGSTLDDQIAFSDAWFASLK
jgi:hypothetical protein